MIIIPKPKYPTALFILAAIVFAVIIAGTLAETTAPATAPTTALAAPSTQPSGDASTDLVTAFYAMLLQERSPTAEQEQAILVDSAFDLRKEIVKQERYAKSPAPIADFFRDHKEWFFPKNAKSLKDVTLSSEFHFLCNLHSLHEPPKKGMGYVLAVFTDDRNARPTRHRTICFRLWYGKIEAAWIDLDGLDVDPIYEKVLNGKQ